jgi:CheY-like chemotaxis protein/two-component sensor histidine kinase
MRELDPKTAHAIEVIERNAEAQIRLIEEVLDVSRIIAGKMPISVESLDIRAVLRSTIDAVRPALQAKGVHLEEHLDQDLPSILADAHRMQQVFWNLLANAVKFTGTDGLITVRARRANGCAEIQVGDSGVGIRREVLPFVFDRFRQADSSTTRTHGGLGLGLAIVRHIVELHGGSVRAESPGEGHGATFTIQLPFDGGIKASASDVSPGRSIVGRAQEPLHGRTILIVEDYDDARELVASVLEAAGATVIAAASTGEALERMAVTLPDMLVTDLGLPGEDGYALMGHVRLRKTAAGRPLPAIALSAYARTSDRERALAAGFLDYFVKPVDPRQLVNAIVRLLDPGQ